VVRAVRLIDAVNLYCQRYGLRSRPKLVHHVNRWGRYVPDDTLRGLAAGVPIFRRTAAEAGLSAATIETTITDLITVARDFGLQVDPGRRLRRPTPRPWPPTVQELGRLYYHVGVARWPLRVRRQDWWRCLLVLGSWSGLRLGDLLGLTWSEIGGGWIGCRASKTGAAHRIPLTPVICRHLDQLGQLEHRTDGQPVLGHATSRHQLYRDFGRICQAAGTRQIRPKQLRQFAITQWSLVSAEAGRIIHGCGLGVMRHYLDQGRVLAAAAPHVELPEEFYSAAERAERISGEARLLERFRRARSADRRLLLAMADRLG
jgi:integrase